MDDVDKQYQRKLGGKFQLQYDSARDVWSDEVQMRAFVSFAIQAPGDPKPGMRVVDLGAGRGRDTIFLLERGFQVTALDLFRMPEWEAIERAYGSDVEFVSCNLLEWDTEARQGEASLVIDNGCYHHQARGAQLAYLRKVRALLVPGGRFSLNVFCSRSESAPGTITLKDGRLVHIYDESSLRLELAAAGFVVTKASVVARPNSNFAYDYLYVNAIQRES